MLYLVPNIGILQYMDRHQVLKWLKDRNLNAAKFAKMLNTTSGTISRFLSGKTKPSGPMIIAINAVMKSYDQKLKKLLT